LGGKQSTFCRALGFEVLHGGEESSFSGLLNLIVQPAERRWFWWERVVFYVADVNALYDRAVAAGYQPATVPHDAEWGERFFDLFDPDGHELSFARPALPHQECYRRTDRQEWGGDTESDRCRRWQDGSAWVRGARSRQRW
jgi:hypothetical protein